MVPFAELVNHENTDVYYDFKYNKENIHAKEESDFPEPKEITEEEEEDVESSQGSYRSAESDSDIDFEYTIEN